MKLPKHMTAYNVKNNSDGFIIKNNSTGKCLFTSSVYELSVKLVVDDLGLFVIHKKDLLATIEQYEF